MSASVTLTTPSLTVTGPFVVTATFSEAVTGFDNPTTDITVTNGTVSPITSNSSTEYTFTVTPSSIGVVTVKVNSGAALTVKNTITRLWAADFSIRGLAWGPDGYLYASQGSGILIKKISPDGLTATNFATVNAPTGLTWGPDGYLYVISNNDTIKKISSDGLTVTTFASNLTYIQFIDFDINGYLYTSATTSNVIKKISPDGLTITNFANINNPNGLTWGPDGYLYVVDYGNRIVKKISSDGLTVTNFATNLDSAPEGIAFGPDGYLYVVHYSSTAPQQTAISKINTNGIITAFIQTQIQPSYTVAFLWDIAFGSSGQFFTCNSLDSHLLAISSPTPNTESNLLSVEQPTAPSAPTLTATANTNNISLSWTASTGTTPITYNVLRSTDNVSFSSLATGLSGTTYTDSSASTNIIYYYKVVAHNSIGDTDSNVDSTIITATAPSAPTLTATANTNNISLSWTASTGTTPITYNVLRSTDNVSFSSLATGLNGTVYVDSIVLNNNTYYYKILAHNSVGDTNSNTVGIEITINNLNKDILDWAQHSIFDIDIQPITATLYNQDSHVTTNVISTEYSFKFINDEDTNSFSIVLNNISTDTAMSLNWPSKVVNPPDTAISASTTKKYNFVKIKEHIYCIKSY